MIKLLNNNFNSGLITINPNEEYHALISKYVRDSINLDKKVLYFSLEIDKELMSKRIGIENSEYLLVEDSPIKNLNNMIDR